MSERRASDASSQRRTWLLAIRPRTLPAAVAPIIVGTAIAIDDGGFHLLSAVVALLVALLLQVGANLANDGLDFARGADSAERTGPLRVTQSGLLTYREVMAGTLVVTVMAALAGLYLIHRGGWPVLVLGIAAVLAMLAYTGGPVPLGYHGLGELTVFLFFGLVGVAGSYYVQAQELPLKVLFFAAPVGALTAAILVVNNLRDIETDARAGKRTLAVRLGSRASVIEYGALLVLAYLVPPALWLVGMFSYWWVVSWLSLPLALILVVALSRERGRLLNRRLAQTAQLTLFFCVLLAVAVTL